jgi:ornithine decarboxylase
MTNDALERYANVEELLQKTHPSRPVYCVYPHLYREAAEHFLAGFPGRVLFAVKANNHPEVLRTLFAAGVRHFDCASLQEITLVHACCPGAIAYFMNPVRFTDDARTAQKKFGVRYFVIDHLSGLAPLLKEIDASSSVIFARMAVSHASAQADLSTKFGALPEDMPALLRAIADSGAEAALAFNVGTGVEDPEAYAYAIGVARDVLQALEFKVRLVDIGGGFPKSYPGLVVPPLDDFFARTREAAKDLPLAEHGELLSEPGRALSAPGLSAVTTVLLKKPDRLYLNDGMYGIFWELRFKAQLRYACRAFRRGRLLDGPTKPFRILGPTCDSTDELPARVDLPANIEVGDHIEFGTIGAYSLSGRTDFNGFYSDHVVTITDESARPPV